MLFRSLGARVTWLHENLGYIDSFLSPEDLAQIQTELQNAYWRPSPTYVAMPDGTRRNIVNSFRSSDSAYYHWFSPELAALLADIDTRISDSFGFDAKLLEPWQATRYTTGGCFDFHRDSGYWGDHPSGERIITFLLHILAADEGGATSFRALGVEVPPAAGRLVFWLNLHASGHADYRMIHASAPVERGTKMTLTTWQRERPFLRIQSPTIKSEHIY